MEHAKLTSARRSQLAHWMLLAAGVLLAAAVLLIPFAACASGPRWVAGPPYFTARVGLPVVWYTTHPLYFTDPGDLSPAVKHAAADALVAAAANVWNVPTTAMVLSRGGMLAEHVSSANAYLGGSGPVFPADVASSNYANIQIAIVYDTDGSVTDLLLGSGASSPAECRQNAVTESVDSILATGYIQHAVLVLNGRCTGSAPEQQLQMQYQLERAFGRVLGLAWSQTNDNVFTGTPTPTNLQKLHWPILHPIDIICGPYTYQCLPQPFTLRDDDVASITTLYPYGSYAQQPATPISGKIPSYTQASRVFGSVTFPTGQGMQGVNVVIQRQQGGWGIPEAFYDTSSVTGFAFQQNAGNPVTGGSNTLAASQGSNDPAQEGFFDLAWFPDIDPPDAGNGGMLAVLTTEAINPLYTGAHSVGPYPLGTVAPSGALESLILNRYAIGPYTDAGQARDGYFTPPDASANCTTSSDGTESSPLAADPSGWWTGVLCAHGHTAWSSFPMRAGHTATIEVAALDEHGLATTAKAMPLIGVWAGSDATGTLPTMAATRSAFNTIALGVTAATVFTSRAQTLRLVVADARGDGRPDFAYRARILYASTVQPVGTSIYGGQITLTGTGFRAGNQVLVNGVAAVVTSVTATAIVAVAPAQSAFAILPGGPVDVEVLDPATGGTATIPSGLTYGTVSPDLMRLVSAPSGTVTVGTSAPQPFAVRMLLTDGITPVAGLPVSFTALLGSVRMSGCAGMPCTLLTDSTGLVSVIVTPTAFGTVNLQAAAVGTSQTASFTATARSITALQPGQYVAANTVVPWAPQVSLIQNGAAANGTEVVWTSTGSLTLTPSSTVVNAAGIAQTVATIGPLASGTGASIQACAWTSLCAGFTVIAVDLSGLHLDLVSGANQSVAASSPFAPIVAMVTDPAGNPVAGAPVAIYQAIVASQPACPARGRCPAAPLLSTPATATITSDINGLVSVTPAQLAAIGETTRVALAAGTQGFSALVITQHP